MKKPYEILPPGMDAGGGGKTIWTPGASRGIATGVARPPGQWAYGGNPVPGMGKQPRAYEIPPAPGVAPKGLGKPGGCGGGSKPEGCGCGGGCGGSNVGSSIRSTPPMHGVWMPGGCGCGKGCGNRSASTLSSSGNHLVPSIKLDMEIAGRIRAAVVDMVSGQMPGRSLYQNVNYQALPLPPMAGFDRVRVPVIPWNKGKLADSGGPRSPAACADIRMQYDAALQRAQAMQAAADEWNGLYVDCSVDDDGMCAMIGNVYAQASQLNANMNSNVVDLNPINELSMYFCSASRRMIFDARLRNLGAFYCAGTGLLARDVMQRGADEAYQEAGNLFNMWLTCVDPDPGTKPSPDPGPGAGNSCEEGSRARMTYRSPPISTNVIHCLGNATAPLWLPTSHHWTLAGCYACCDRNLTTALPICLGTCHSDCRFIQARRDAMHH
jgi:hypothetical protein